ncbi:Gfo/Idh/MocA family oxidoreductase [Leptospira sp. 201903070]|uniref:Gfo/Idh/MocA family oxidoreductase n=1 Tax=Leptospira ainlahdjerensis TaxID=2810033 RepID=A0ABS2UAF1_9LEPT|nr:Gfo/Idh/MocA family oxidoreductase [Leptospira ainlahdjerensis]MBM9577335.1 Gfo/Idh/MocA family oxidoreductase [Leptospira ainlahdjerensis]
MKFRTFLIGLGQIGMGYDFDKDPLKFRITHLTAVSNHPNYELVGAYDPVEEARVKFGKKSSANVYIDLKEGLTQTSPDFVIIATPTRTHFEILQIVLESSNPSFLLCEKPLSYNLDESLTMISLCEKKDVRLFVNYQRRYFPSSKKIKSLLEKVNHASGFIKGVCWYSKGLVHNGGHFLNLLQYWLGPIKNGSVIQQNRFLENNDWEPDVFFRFERGDVFFLSSREEDYSNYSIELVTSEGKLSYLRGGEEVFWESKTFDPIYPEYTILDSRKEYLSNDSNFSQYHVLNELVKTMRGQDAEFCDSKSALQINYILNQIMEQSK